MTLSMLGAKEREKPNRSLKSDGHSTGAFPGQHTQWFLTSDLHGRRNGAVPGMSRIVMPGLPYHVTQGGVRSIAIFDHDGDRNRYVELNPMRAGVVMRPEDRPLVEGPSSSAPTQDRSVDHGSDARGDRGRLAGLSCFIRRLC